MVLPRSYTPRANAKHELMHLSGWYTLLQRVLRVRADGLEGVGSILGICQNKWMPKPFHLSRRFGSP